MYNNYGYNPYGTYIPPRPMQQPIQQSSVMNTQSPAMSGLNGKVVDSIEVVKATDVNFDGSISYFPLTNGSAVITKQLQNDGTSKITIFKPITEEKEEKRYITSEELEKSLKHIKIDELEDIKEDITDLKQELKELKKKKVKDE